jgi:hypothetical protein
MTISISGAAPGPTAGPAGEHAFAAACQDLGCGIEPFGVEHRLSKYALNIAHANHASFAADPDFIIYRHLTTNWYSNWYRYWLPPDKIPIIFGVDVKGVVIERDNSMIFSIKESAVTGMIAFANTHHMWGVFALVPWDATDIRIIKPFEVMTWPRDHQYEKYIVDGSKYPTLYQWLAEFPPYVGGQLARNWYPEQPAISPAPPQATYPAQPS